MTKKEKTCCFTGHRIIPHAQYDILAERLESTLKSLIETGITYFGAGGALGFDTMAAQTILKLKHQYPHIKLILVLPCLSQTKGWAERDQKIYEEIKAQADKTVYTSQGYTSDCMFKRNRHLIDGSSVCVCYLTNKRGGTAYTVRYAHQQRVKVLNLA